MNDSKNPDHWRDRVSKSISKIDLPKAVWERILKIRNSPIRLIEDVIIGNPQKPHIVLPSGMKGYLLDYPDEFFLTEENREVLGRHNEIFQRKFSEIEGLPAILCGYGDIVFLNDYEYEIIEPFFDIDIACYAESILREGGTDAST
jgi:hypothetical protein